MTDQTKAQRKMFMYLTLLLREIKVLGFTHNPKQECWDVVIRQLKEILSTVENFKTLSAT